MMTLTTGRVPRTLSQPHYSGWPTRRARGTIDQGVQVNRKLLFSGLAAGALAVSVLAAIQPGASASPALAPVTGTHAVHVCSTHPAPGHAACFAMAMTAANGKVTGSVSPLAAPLAAGFTPTDVQSAYKLTGLSS